MDLWTRLRTRGQVGPVPRVPGLDDLEIITDQEMRILALRDLIALVDAHKVRVYKPPASNVWIVWLSPELERPEDADAGRVSLDSWALAYVAHHGLQIIADGTADVAAS